MTKSNLVLFTTMITFASSSYGYLDGGSASMLLQLLLGGFAVMGGLLNMYWHKFKSFFKFKKDDKHDNDQNKPTKNNNPKTQNVT